MTFTIVNMIHFSAPQSPVRQRTRALRGEEILEAARDLVVAEGVEAVTLQRVAKALGYVPAALYRYYPSKEALMAALLGRAVAQLGSALQDAVTAFDARLAGDNVPAGTAALGRVWLCVETFLAWAQGAPHQATLVALGMADPRVLVPQQELALGVFAHAASGVGVLVGAMQDAMDQGSLAARQPAPVAALLLVGAVQGVWSMQKMMRLAPGALDVEQLVRAQARVVLVGLGATQETLERAVQLGGRP